MLSPECVRVERFAPAREGGRGRYSLSGAMPMYNDNEYVSGARREARASGVCHEGAPCVVLQQRAAAQRGS